MEYRKSILINPEYHEKIEPYTQKGTKWMQKNKKPSKQAFIEQAIDYYIKHKHKNKQTIQISE